MNNIRIIPPYENETNTFLKILSWKIKAQFVRGSLRVIIVIYLYIKIYIKIFLIFEFKFLN